MIQILDRFDVIPETIQLKPLLIGQIKRINEYFISNKLNNKYEYTNNLIRVNEFMNLIRINEFVTNKRINELDTNMNILIVNK